MNDDWERVYRAERISNFVVDCIAVVLTIAIAGVLVFGVGSTILGYSFV